MGQGLREDKHLESRVGTHGTVGEMLHDEGEETGVIGAACASRTPGVKSEAHGSRLGWCNGAGQAVEVGQEAKPGEPDKVVW